MAKMNQALNDLLRYSTTITPQKRSMFSTKRHSNTTTLDSSFLVPLMYDRVVPGDEKKIRYSGLARMTTPLHPTMDQAFLDVWCFYVPDRLVWNHAREFYGENKDAAFNPDGEYEIPSLTPKQFYVVDGNAFSINGIHSLNDYFGMPVCQGDQDAEQVETEFPNFKVDATLWRSYQLIWNEWFRNSSVQPALQLNDGDEVTTSEWQVIRTIREVNKLPDMLTSLLRSPQAGDDVLLPISGNAPVVTTGQWTQAREPLMFANASTMSTPIDNTWLYASGNYGQLKGYTDEEYTPVGSDPGMVPKNLWADLSAATASSINDLRAAITVQQLLELDAIAGKRYQNLIYTHFGVFTPDGTLQRPELLGASRTEIGMRQVLQTSASTELSPQGNAAAVSVTNVDNEWICNKAFTEPGWILVLGAIRPIHSYSGRIDPLLTQLTRYEKYWPVFDNLGNQPVYLKNVGANIVNGSLEFADPDTVFGYKEAWQEYRVKENNVTGKMRSVITSSLSSWNYSDAFTLEAAPTLSNSFIRERKDYIGRTLAVIDEPQFILDSYFDYIDIKNMSVHSTPGLTRL